MPKFLLLSRFLPAFAVACWACSSAMAASHPQHSNPRPPHPPARRATPAVHHTPTPVHQQTVTRPATPRASITPPRVVTRTVTVPRNNYVYVYGRSYPNNRLALYNRYGSYSARRGYQPYRTVRRNRWIQGVVVSTRRGSGQQAGTLTIRVRRPSYARRLGGQINGQVALVGNNRSGASSYLRSFQVSRQTRFQPGQVSLVYLKKGHRVAVLPRGNNTRIASTVQLQSRNQRLAQAAPKL